MLGIVYKTIDYKEKSKLVYLLTPQGLDSILARGAKDYKNGLFGFTSLLSFVDYEKTNSKLPVLIEFETINNFTKLKEDIVKFNYALSMLEIARQSTDLRTERIFNFTKMALEELEKSTNPKSVLFIYLVKMLKVFGIYSQSENKFKSELKNKIIVAYNSVLSTNIEITKDDIMAVIDYYDELGALYIYNIKHAIVR